MKNGTSYHVKIGDRYEDILVNDFKQVPKIDMKSVWLQKIQEIDDIIGIAQSGMTFLSRSGGFYLSVSQLIEKRESLVKAYNNVCGGEE